MRKTKTELRMNIKFTSTLLFALLSSVSAFGGDTIFVERFDSQAAFDKFKVIDNNQDGSTWSWDKDKQNARCQYSSNSQSSDDWLLTLEQTLKGGRVYGVSYRIYGDGLGYTEHFATAWGSVRRCHRIPSCSRGHSSATKKAHSIIILYAMPTVNTVSASML